MLSIGVCCDYKGKSPIAGDGDARLQRRPFPHVHGMCQYFNATFYQDGEHLKRRRSARTVIHNEQRYCLLICVH